MAAPAGFPVKRWDEAIRIGATVLGWSAEKVETWLLANYQDYLVAGEETRYVRFLERFENRLNTPPRPKAP